MVAKPVGFTDIRKIMHISPVIPVSVIHRLEDAVPLAQALMRGGLPVMEVALRTPCSSAAIRASVGDAIVGAGTITRPRDFHDSRAAGAHGTWVAPSSAIDAQDWDTIESLAKDAAALRTTTQPG